MDARERARGRSHTVRVSFRFLISLLLLTHSFEHKSSLSFAFAAHGAPFKNPAFSLSRRSKTFFQSVSIASKISRAKSRPANSRAVIGRDWRDFCSEAGKTPTFSQIRHPGSGEAGAAPRARHNAPRRETAARDCFEAIERRYAILRVISTRARVPRAAPDNRRRRLENIFSHRPRQVSPTVPASDPAAGVAVPSIWSLTRFPRRFPRADRASL